MKKSIKVGSQFSGVGAFEQSLLRLGINFKNIYAADWDKYARQTYLLNFEEPEYYVKDVHDTPIEEITEKYGSLDITMFSPPCQAFSMAGKRLGKEDKRGILFFNSLEFIQENKPRYFIFENVKGLLSHDKTDKKKEYGNTFQEWINYLGGKSINGVHTFFPYEDAVPYHVYYQVMNAKHYGVPQNRERIFIIGIRDDADNTFSFPKPFHLVKRLKDVLESEVDEKYFLSDKMIESITYGKKSNGEVANLNKGGERGSVYSEETDAMSCLSATDYKQPKQIQIGTWRTHEDGRGFRATEDNNCPTIPARAREDGSGQPVIKIGAIRGRNPQNPLSRVSGLPTEQMLEINENGTSNALTTVQKDNVVVIPANNSKGYDIAEEEEDSINFSNPNSETRRGRVGHGVSQTLDTACNQGILTKKMTKQQIEKFNDLEVDENIAGCITHAIGRMGSSDEYISSVKRNAIITQRIRRLTPFECFRLMDFNENFKWNVSDSQAYKQAGNSICVGVLVEIIKKLKL